MSEKIVGDAEIVPISSLKLHPRNPRIGNVAVIAESLQVNGQFKPVLVQRSTRTVLGGNHTVKAARSLKWKNVGVVWVDCDDQEALEILLSDNRASDSGRLNEDMVFTITQFLPSLEGTGYADGDLKMPDYDFDDLLKAPKNQEDEEQDGPGPEVKDKNSPVDFQVGSAKGKLANPEWKKWRQSLPKKNDAATQEVLKLLDLVVEIHEPEEKTSPTEVELVDIEKLRPYPGNPNEGDVGMVAELLGYHGQTRPIVASRFTNRILAGHTVVEAARQLGWTRVKVVWVEVDNDGERRIVLVDNRAAQLAKYNNDDLGSLIASVGAEGVPRAGFNLSDLDDVIAGKQLKPSTYTRAQSQIQIGTLRAKVPTALLINLNLTQGQELIEVAAMLGMDPSQVVG